MSNNVILTPKVYARLTLMGLGGSLKVAKNMSTSVTPEFAKKDYKVGDTVQVRKPYRFVGGSGIGWDPEPIVDQVTPIKVQQIAHVHFMMDSVERTLDVREAMKLYTQPTAMSLGNKINSAAATFAANNALSSVGTPGTAPTSEATYLAAGDIIVELGLPDDEDLTLIVNRRMSTAFVSGTKTLFNPAGSISQQWKKGSIQDSLGYNIVRDQTINTRTNGTFAGTPLVNLSQQAEGGNNSTMTLNTDGWSSGACTLNVGDRFTIGSASSATIGGVNSCHPQTRQSTGRQQIVTVVAQISDTTGTINMVVSPALTPSGQYQNVDSAPVDNAIITMIGTTALTNIQQGLLLHENAFAFVNVPLSAPLPSGVEAVESETDSETGLSIRYIRYFDGDNSAHKHRFDSLYDFGSMYKEMAVVIQA